ncbi:hypothetical protein D3C72_179920 [compost metagenome]
MLIYPPALRRILESAALIALAWGATHGLGWRLPGLDLMAMAVALAGARFGFIAGAGAGLAAAALRLWESGLPPASLLSLSADRGIVPEAMAFFLLGSVLGLVGDAQLRARVPVRERAEALEGQLNSLSERHEVLVSAKEHLDRRIVGQVQSISSLYEAAKELEVLDPDAVLPATLRLIQRFLGAEAASAYQLEGYRLTLTASVGEHAERPRMLVVDDGPVGTAVRTGKTTGIHRKEDYARAKAFLVAPIRRPDGQIRGVLTVERIAFAALTPSATQLLDLIADWTSRALSNSEAYAHSQEQQAVHPVTSVHRLTYGLDRLEQEWAIAKRYDLPLSAILIRQPALLDEPPTERPLMALPLVLTLKRLIRGVDMLSHFRTDDSFLVVLPMTGQEGAQVLAERISGEVPGLVVAVGANDDPDCATSELMLQMMQVMAFDLEEA